MPTFVDLQKRLKRHSRMCGRLGTDEVLLIDARADMRPGDFVEEKLRAAQEVTRATPDADERIVGTRRN